MFNFSRPTGRNKCAVYVPPPLYQQKFLFLKKDPKINKGPFYFYLLSIKFLLFHGDKSGNPICSPSPWIFFSSPARVSVTSRPLRRTNYFRAGFIYLLLLEGVESKLLPSRTQISKGGVVISQSTNKCTCTGCSVSAWVDAK